MTLKNSDINSNKEPLETPCLCEGGLRRKGQFKNTFPNKPLISVITVVLNSRKYIEDTIQNVTDQTYDNIEYIVIDGGSTDGTLDIIKKYDPLIDYWVSKPDNGIYFAMNLGIEVARGDWINFINSADEYFDVHVIEQLLSKNLRDADIVYGNTEIKYQGFKTIKRAQKLENTWKGMPFCHASALCKTSLLKKNMFDTSYQLSSDFNFFYNAFISKRKFLYYDTTVSSIPASGLTDFNRRKALRENWRCVSTHSNNLKIHFYYTLQIIISCMKTVIKRILGIRLTTCIQKLKYDIKNGTCQNK